MASIPLYNAQGSEVGTLPLPDSIFGVAFNEALVHQAIVSEDANQRQGTSNTKQRSDVRGGGRKPYKQKGTGRARQGTIRAPHYRGGGVVFGPHPRDYRKAFPVGMRRGAMRSVLSNKVVEGAIIGLETFALDAIKTKEALRVLTALGLSDARRILVIIPEHSDTLNRSLRNLPNVELRFAPNFSVRDALVATKIVLVRDAVSKIEAVWTPNSAKVELDQTADGPVQLTVSAAPATGNASVATNETAQEAAHIIESNAPVAHVEAPDADTDETVNETAQEVAQIIESDAPVAHVEAPDDSEANQ